MAEDVPTTLRLTVVPVAPDTVESLYRDIPALIRDAADEEGQGEILDEEELVVGPAADIPGTLAAGFVMTISTSAALALWKRFVLPRLEGEYELHVDLIVRVEKKRKKKAKRKRP